jgi:hypothetical protein
MYSPWPPWAAQQKIEIVLSQLLCPRCPKQVQLHVATAGAIMLNSGNGYTSLVNGHLRLVYTGDMFGKNVWDSDRLYTCFEHPGWRDTDRIISVLGCTAQGGQAKYIVCRCCWHYHAKLHQWKHDFSGHHEHLQSAALNITNIIYFLAKQAALMRRSTVLSLPLLCLFPGATIG